MAVTNETWGLITDTEIVGSYIAQYGFDASNRVATPTKTDHLIRHACAMVNGVLLEARYDLPTLAADTTSVAYIVAQGCAAKIAAAQILRTTQGVDQDLATAWIEECMDHLKEIIANGALLGAGDDTPAAGWTTTQGLGLDTSETKRAARRLFDDVRGRTTLVDDPFYW